MSAYPEWRSKVEKALAEAQARPVVIQAPPRSSADVLSKLRTELQSVRMAARVRAKVDALLDEVSTHTGD